MKPFNIKHLTFIIFILALFIFGCSENKNVVGGIETDCTRKVSIDISIYMSYGFCDTNICWGEDVPIFFGALDHYGSDTSYFYTLPEWYSISNNECSCTGIYLDYETNIPAFYDIGYEISLINEKGIHRLRLDYEVGYQIIFGTLNNLQ